MKKEITSEQLYEAIGGVGEDLLQRSETAKNFGAKRRISRGRIVTIVALAAVAALSIGGLTLIRQSSYSGSTFVAPASDKDAAAEENAMAPESHAYEAEYVEGAASESANDEDASMDAYLSAETNDMAQGARGDVEAENGATSENAPAEPALGAARDGVRQATLLSQILELQPETDVVESDLGSAIGQIKLKNADDETYYLTLFENGFFSFDDAPDVYYRPDDTLFERLSARIAP